jgi:hypothetical protein
MTLIAPTAMILRHCHAKLSLSAEECGAFACDTYALATPTGAANAGGIARADRQNPHIWHKQFTIKMRNSFAPLDDGESGRSPILPHVENC